MYSDGYSTITTNLSGFGCYMEDLIENSQDYGIYIVDRRMKSVDESINQLTDQMFEFTQKTRRQRINQRNRVERLSDLLDWKRMGLEYVKARMLSLRRAYPEEYNQAGNPFENDEKIKLTRPLSVPGSPRDNKYGAMTPGDLGTLQENNNADYLNWTLKGDDDDEDVTLRGASVAPSDHED